MEVSRLIQKMKDDDVGVQVDAALEILQISEIELTQSINLLIDALKDEEYIVRKTAAEALGKTHDIRSIEPLIAALKDEESGVRKEAAISLRRVNIEDKRIIEPLIAALKDVNSDVRNEAAYAFVSLKDARAVEPLMQALDDPDFGTSYHAAQALGNQGDSRAVARLRSVLVDESSSIKDAAANAIEKLSTTVINSFSDKPPSGVDLSPSKQSNEVMRYISRRYPELYSKLIDAGKSKCTLSDETVSNLIGKYEELISKKVGRDPGVWFKIYNTKCPSCGRMVDISCGVTVVINIPLVKNHIYFEFRCPICNESGSNSYSI